MKTIYTLSIFLFLFATGLAQETINYKAVINDNSGNALVNQAISLRFTILNDSGTDYMELHTPTTDANGIIIVNIGDGTPLFQTYNDVDWKLANCSLKVEVDSNTGNGFVDMGTSPFNTVPYALEVLNPVFEKVGGNAFKETGNIGIGTNDPQEKLHINDADDVSILLSTAQNSGSSSIRLENGLDVNLHTHYTIKNDDKELSISRETELFNGSDITALKINAQLGLEVPYGLTLGSGAYIEEFSSDYFDTQNSHLKVPTQAAVKTFVDDAISLATNNNGINGLSDGKTDPNGSSLFLGTEAGLNDDGSNNRNVGVGYLALYSNTTGNSNTATGNQALYSNTSGNSNTAIGDAALYANIYGFNNTAVGSFTLSGNTSGNYNTAMGYTALQKNTEGSSNAAYGSGALFSNTSGYSNVALGNAALYENTIGNENTAVGTGSLYGNTTGNNNTAIGLSALGANTIGSNSTASGYKSLYSNTTGTSNTATGSAALYSNTTGSNNTANGYITLFDNTTGYNNTANGRSALELNSTGSNNTANGYRALSRNTTGEYNTSNGAYSMEYNTTGYSNVAIGANALNSNTTGNTNTAIGESALNSNTIGLGNVAIGSRAGYYETGSNKLYISNSSTSDPLIYGEFDNKELTINGATIIKSFNNATPDLILSGTSNTVAGDDGIISSDPNYAGSDIFMRSYDAIEFHLDFDDNENGDFVVKAGNGDEVFSISESGNVRVNGSLVHSSDRRLKKDIETLPYGLQEVLQLQPKAYNWKGRTQEHKSIGLIAQEVQLIIKEVVTAQDDDEKTLGISYTELIPVLINAIQEQQEQIATLESINKDKEHALASILKRLDTLENKDLNSNNKEVKLSSKH